MNGNINGNLVHIQSQVGRKLRSRPFTLNIFGDNHNISLGNVQTETMEVTNNRGSVSFAGLTVQTGRIQSKSIESQKIMASSEITLAA